MMRHLLTVLILLFVHVTASAGTRTVTLEWEPEGDATSYEIEIGTQGSPKPQSTEANLREPTWVGHLKSGRYWMRVRGRDDREVPGDWSEQVKFEVKLDAPVLELPAENAVLESSQGQTEVTLRWHNVEGAQNYTVAVIDAKGRPVVTKKVTDASINVALESAANYTWFVQALDENGNEGQKLEKAGQFLILGKAVPPPVVREPASVYVRSLEIEKPDEAELVHVVVKRFDSSAGNWQTVLDRRGKKGALPFKASWPGGRYQVVATSEAKNRAPSSASTTEFDVIDGARTLDAENRALLRQSIDRTDDYFVSANYILSTLTYASTLIEENRSVSLSAFTGTLGIGGGRFKKGSHYGIFASFDAGGYKIEDQLKQYFGGEISGLYKFAPNHASDLRFKVGAFFSQAPQILTIKNGVTLGAINAMGPVGGVEYWYAFTPKWAAQTSATVRAAVAGSSASGSPIDLSLNYQAGILAGYRAQKSFTLLGGYSYRKESYQFAGTNSSLGVSGTNRVEVIGHYLQLLFEYEL